MGSGCNETQNQFLRFQKKISEEPKAYVDKNKTNKKAAATNKRQNP